MDPPSVGSAGSAAGPTLGAGGMRLSRSSSLPSLGRRPLERQMSGLSGLADSGLESEPVSGERLVGPPSRPTSAAPGRRVVTATMAQHYYLEGGWGWVVVVCHLLTNVTVHGLQLSVGILARPVTACFHQTPSALGWLGATSLGFSLLISPLTIAICRRKSTRLTAVIGGLVAALGILFTSFASRFHQLFLSYGAVFAVGVSMTRDASTLMVGQYFKRRRELVETVVLSGSGVGLAVMSAFLHGAIGSEGWRLGLQAVTGVIFFTFLLGTFYRSASLYHPQRRAILHLKNSKKKVKGKNKVDEKPPFFDCSMLKSQTVRILLVSASLSSVGLHSPLIYMAHQAQQDGLSEGSVLLLQTYLGLGWALGCWAFGFVVVRNNQECRISRQYLCQASSFLCGACQLALPAVRGYSGYVLFAWLYGLFYGGYQYSLKMCTYEKVRARNFAKTWGFVQGSQALPMVIGVPVTGYINVAVGGKAGYYFSATFVVIGSISIFLIAFHRRRGRRRAHRHRHEPAPGGEARAEPPETPRDRADSLPDVDERVLNLLKQRVAAVNSSHELRKQELTCISEEGIADMDLPDALFEDIELELNLLQGDITSCNKVENYLVLSEYENNLIAEQPTDRRPAVGRRRSLVKQVSSMRSRAAQILASKPADIPEERSDVENDLPSDSSVSSRLFRGWIRGGRRKEAPTEVPAVHPVSVQTPAPPANADPTPQT
ncbi:monocarboxylate transporter 2-like [Amphibalanus amphitrite]|uniref:monocarboxylate transporter 2-like n=1 Tax=Amphibalanus amphitrite TaxID=1232801 RepID=UPI001C913785|nr:monocarboxylate transporter 2-like [Amphibalanus amphitrite]